MPRLAEPSRPAPVAGDRLPSETDEADPETERFRELHQRLHEAAMAVFEAGEGEIRYSSSERQFVHRTAVAGLGARRTGGESA